MPKEINLEAKYPPKKRSNSGVELPAVLPVLLSSSSQGGVELPLTLPFVLSSGGKKTVQLPLTLPFTFESTGVQDRREIIINMKEQVRFMSTNKSTKFPVREQARGKSIKIPLSETALTFEGFVIQENVIDKMVSSLVLEEEVRNRILVDVSMTDRNNLVLKWYGEKVDELDIFIRPFVELEYQLYSTHKWGEGEANVFIDDNAYYIQLVGKNGSGESFELEIDVSTPIQIKSDVTISLNEKIYDIDIDYTSAYRFEVTL